MIIDQDGFVLHLFALMAGEVQLVEGLPVHNFYTDEGDIALKCPTEVPNQVGS